MSKLVTYLLGAGASVKSIPAVGDFNNHIRMYADPGAAWSLQKSIRSALGESEEGGRMIKRLSEGPWIQDLNAAYEGAQRFGTVDTYAKSLSFQQDPGKLEMLKRSIDLTISLSEARKGADPRYFAWLSALMNCDSESGRIHFAPGINILSWNYDNQIELALAELISAQVALSILEGTHEASPIVDFPFYHKLNGRAGHLRIERGTEDRIVNQVLLGESEKGDGCAARIGRAIVSEQFHPPSDISFAWAGRFNEQKTAIKEALGSTDTLVVIGYSFPAFNRKIDSEIFKMMRDIREVKIQDPEYQGKVEIVREILSETHGPKLRQGIIQVTGVAGVEQFFIPNSVVP